MNSKEELTPDGFLKLSLMEGKENVDELWVTLKTMGYNNGLELVKVEIYFFFSFSLSIISMNLNLAACYAN